MPSAEYDLRYLSSGVDQLESYLLSTEVYWPIGVSAPAGEPPYPQMTLGGLLLARLRAESTARTPTQQAELARLIQQMETTRTRWRSAWGRKASAEFGSRINLWRDFLEEYRKSPSGNYDRYAYEVGRRVMLHLLSPDADDLRQADQDLLAVLDQLLRAAVIPGEFIWDAELAPSFPKETYWYLYGQVPS